MTIAYQNYVTMALHFASLVEARFFYIVNTYLPYVVETVKSLNITLDNLVDRS